MRVQTLLGTVCSVPIKGTRLCSLVGDVRTYIDVSRLHVDAVKTCERAELRVLHNVKVVSLAVFVVAAVALGTLVGEN